jgi:hypothetical protein
MKQFFGFLWILATAIGGCTSTHDAKKGADAAEETPARALPGDFERAAPPAMLTDPRERADYLIAHFWDKFDFTDTMYCHVPDITVQAFVDFLALFPHASSHAKISAGVKKMLASAGVDPVMYTYFGATAERYLYNPNSPMRNDEYYIPFVEHIVESSNVPEVRKMRFRGLLALLYRNRPGGKAEDFTYTTASGKTGRLYALRAEHLLLMFHDPDCMECQHTVEILKNSAAVAAAVSSGRLQVLAVYPDGNAEAWEQHRDDIPPSWINARDKSQTIRNSDIYDLKAIPTLYLLDRDKRVILKDASTADIHAYFEQQR